MLARIELSATAPADRSSATDSPSTIRCAFRFCRTSSGMLPTRIRGHMMYLVDDVGSDHAVLNHAPPRLTYRRRRRAAVPAFSLTRTASRVRSGVVVADAG